MHTYTTRKKARMSRNETNGKKSIFICVCIHVTFFLCVALYSVYAYVCVCAVENKEDKFLLKALLLVSFSKRKSDELVTMLLLRIEFTKIKQYVREIDEWLGLFSGKTRK